MNPSDESLRHAHRGDGSAPPRPRGEAWWLPGAVMTVVLLTFAVPAGLVKPSEVTVVGEVVESCAVASGTGLERAATLVDATSCPSRADS